MRIVSSWWKACPTLGERCQLNGFRFCKLTSFPRRTKTVTSLNNREKYFFYCNFFFPLSPGVSVDPRGLVRTSVFSFFSGISQSLALSTWSRPSGLTRSCRFRFLFTSPKHASPHTRFMQFYTPLHASETGNVAVERSEWNTLSSCREPCQRQGVVAWSETAGVRL